MNTRSRTIPVLTFCFIAGLRVLTGSAFGQIVPAGYTIPDSTLSPDHRYGVTVPSLDTDNPQNKLVEVKTGRVLAVIQADTGYEHANHVDLLPSRWSSDGSFLLWEVDGKWCDAALVLLKLQKGAVKWQLDLLKTGQQAILTRTQQARPKQYLAEKKKNKGNGSAYPDGFTVDVAAESNEGTPLSFPLVVHVYLTSNPKGIEDRTRTELNARLDAVVDMEGKFNVTKFYLGTEPPAPRW